jgi:hypothetical protein
MLSSGNCKGQRKSKNVKRQSHRTCGKPLDNAKFENRSVLSERPKVCNDGAGVTDDRTFDTQIFVGNLYCIAETQVFKDLVRDLVHVRDSVRNHVRVRASVRYSVRDHVRVRDSARDSVRNSNTLINFQLICRSSFDLHARIAKAVHSQLLRCFRDVGAQQEQI